MTGEGAMVGVFVLPAWAVTHGPKAYAVAPVRLTTTQAIVTGPAVIVWTRISGAGFAWGTKRFRKHGGGWRSVPREGPHAHGWRLMRVEEGGER